MTMSKDVLVIGAGLAGLTAAWQAAAAGKRVRLVAKGWGATHWHAGCVDVLGYWPQDSDTAVTHPPTAIAQLIADNPQHPYALLGVEQLQAALTAFQALCQQVGYPMRGSLEQNWRLPTAVGHYRPTCLAPETMVAGDLSSSAPMLLVGFKQMVDFYPNIAADNLTKLGVPARHVVLDLPVLAARHGTTAVVLAQMMEDAAFRAEVVRAVRPHLGAAQRVGFPAVLGRQQATAVHADLQAQLGLPVFEIPGLPPSVPGIRLHHMLKAAIEQHGGAVYDGMEAIGFEQADGRVTAVHTETASRPRAHRYEQVVLATGGLLGGGITTNHEGLVREVVFDLPLHAPANRQEWFERDLMHPQGHPVYRSGVTVTADFQPANGDGQAIYANLFAAGATLAHGDFIRERSFDGVALGTGFAVGRKL